MTGTNQIVVDYDVPMRTRDGLTLYADVYRPKGDGRYPALLMRSPYDKSQAQDRTEPEFFPQHGYGVILQDVRGRWKSEGEFYPRRDDATDGYDAVEWAARLPWCNGSVGMVGQSYLASTQFSAASLRPPSLKAASPVAGPARMDRFTNGILDLGWNLAYFLSMVRPDLKRRGLSDKFRPFFAEKLRDPRAPFSFLTDEAYRHLPLSDWAKWLADDLPFLADFFREAPESRLWADNDQRTLASGFDIPMFHVGSWYDAFAADTLQMYGALKANAATERARHGQKLLMGPWAHLIPFARPTSKGTGDIDFGEHAKIDLHTLQLAWFDEHLKGVAKSDPDEPPVRIFVMGTNVWRDELAWPPARMRYVDCYLGGDGTAKGDVIGGTLSFAAPSEAASDAYLYDPDDPTPTLGGNGLGLALGVRDQRAVEARSSVLVYTGEPMVDPLEITGPVRLALHASSSAVDTDFMAKLIDVHPNGFAQNVAEGVIRARYRNSTTEPELLVPNKPYLFDIDLGSTSHVVLPGHSLRLHVTSSNFPRYERNLNTGEPFGQGSRPQVARQEIHHGGALASRLRLPIIGQA